MKKKNRWTGAFALVIVAAAFAGGFLAASALYTAPAAQEIRKFIKIMPNSTEFIIPDSGEFGVANVTLVGSDVGLRSGCYAISFRVTDDQAFSIRHGLEGTMSVRPLTHDIFKDVIEDFNIDILGIRIERFGEEIYYARMFVQQSDKILDIDVRPSDAIAIALKTRNTLYINETMLREKGTNICGVRG